MPWDAQQILGCADIIADRRHERVVLFSDITRLLASAGTSWGQLRVDWEHGLRELGQGGFPALLLTITGRAYELICNPALHVLLSTVWTVRSRRRKTDANSFVPPSPGSSKPIGHRSCKA